MFDDDEEEGFYYRGAVMHKNKAFTKRSSSFVMLMAVEHADSKLDYFKTK